MTICSLGIGDSLIDFNRPADKVKVTSKPRLRRVAGWNVSACISVALESLPPITKHTPNTKNRGKGLGLSGLVLVG